MADDKKIGDINVTLGDGNQIGDIGHKFIFSEPPPNPNSIFQEGKLVGAIGTPPQHRPNGFLFIEKLFVGSEFNGNREFTLQGVRLKLETLGTFTKSSAGGRPAEITYWNSEYRMLL